ncbi:hypothetical protein NDU88_002391 [Pleurodeles waltl]|uniref:Uncharacterized protein n=1 Tax=Pleurodeles waltl TaxID=8319 RepID=A0AAV7VCQ5_PLEWA|nr:hypothetical protein NDU88_002391 [Pleurodeles waltl]
MLRGRRHWEERAQDRGTVNRTQERWEETDGWEKRQATEERGKAEDTVRKTGGDENTERRAQHVEQMNPGTIGKSQRRKGSHERRPGTRQFLGGT